MSNASRAATPTLTAAARTYVRVGRVQRWRRQLCLRCTKPRRCKSPVEACNTASNARLGIRIGCWELPDPCLSQHDAWWQTVPKRALLVFFFSPK